jgi:uncharacterized membrane protein YphA (DoxX/SURF4 family)
MHSLPTLLMMFAGVGVLFTIVQGLFTRPKNLLITFLQHFTGVWFIFSGIVKAIDPTGTAYKMEEYFAHFETTLEPTPFKFMAPMFPWLNQYGHGFSIFMIVLEIALGLMLIIGFRRKLTAWLFFLIVLFFTFLTGFTYLTGFVPSDANFFDFAKWGGYIKEQMRVTDCGCFGDFIKLDPKISFFKDIFLLIPALIFLFRSKSMHQLFTSRLRGLWTGLTTVAALGFSYYNTYVNEPVVDFRPFAAGAEVRKRKAMEADARGNIDIIGWIMENKNTGQTVKEMNPSYADVAKQYPKDAGWKVKDQVKTEPAIIDVTGYEIFNPNTQESKTVQIKNLVDLVAQYPDSIWQVRKELGNKVPFPTTKISDFSIEDPVAGDMTETILEEKGKSLFLVLHTLKGKISEEQVTVQDTTWAYDTVMVVSTQLALASAKSRRVITPDSATVIPRIAGVQPKQVTKSVFKADPEWADFIRNKVNPILDAAEKKGYKVFAVTAAFSDVQHVADFRHETQSAYPYYQADDKLLKTIMRSNPGLVLMENGVLVQKYHMNHLPTGL